MFSNGWFDGYVGLMVSLLDVDYFWFGNVDSFI